MSLFIQNYINTANDNENKGKLLLFVKIHDNSIFVCTSACVLAYFRVLSSLSSKTGSVYSTIALRLPSGASIVDCNSIGGVAT